MRFAGHRHQIDLHAQTWPSGRHVSVVAVSVLAAVMVPGRKVHRDADGQLAFSDLATLCALWWVPRRPVAVQAIQRAVLVRKRGVADALVMVKSPVGTENVESGPNQRASAAACRRSMASSDRPAQCKINSCHHAEHNQRLKGGALLMIWPARDFSGNR
jgi:hypothetical protein